MAGKTAAVLVFGSGFVVGWAVRSLADSPQGVGVKLLGLALNAKERVGGWAAVERDRLEDMVAEARSRTEPDISGANGTTNGSGFRARTTDEEP
jgi:hypothetical protein